MSLDVDLIIPVEINIASGGLGSTNFGACCIFYADATDPKDQGKNVFFSSTAVKTRFPDRDELNEFAQAWFRKADVLITYGYDETFVPPPPKDAADSPLVAPEEPKTRKELLVDKLAKIAEPSKANTFITAMTEAANQFWFYTPFITECTEDLTGDNIVNVAKWCEANTRFLFWTVYQDDDAKNPAITTDDGSLLVEAGQRRCDVSYSDISKTVGIREASELAKVNYEAANDYKDLEYKSIGLATEKLSDTELATLMAKGFTINIEVASKGSLTPAVLINTVSTSPYNELVSEVIATDAYGIGMQTALYNEISSKRNFPQTPDGQQYLISVADTRGEIAIANGFLGERAIIDPVSGEDIITRGYITLTKPEDIENISPEARAAHKAAPIIQNIYRAGSAHTVELKINVI